MWTGSGGISYLWNGTRFTRRRDLRQWPASGFQYRPRAPYAQVNAGLSREFDIPGWNPVTLRFDVVNVFDTSYVIRNGTRHWRVRQQYGPRRGYYFGVAQKFGPGAIRQEPPVPATAPFRAGLASRISKDPIEAVWTWTGFYIGGNVGYSASRFSTDTFYSDLSAGTPLRQPLHQ